MTGVWGAPTACGIGSIIAHFPGEAGGYFRGSLMLLPVFPRGGADIGLEHPGKVAGGGKPEIRPDGGEGLIGIAEEALGLLGLFLQNKIGEGLAGFLLEPAGEIGLRRFT